VATIEHIKAIRGVTERIQIDTGSAFISKAMGVAVGL